MKTNSLSLDPDLTLSFIKKVQESQDSLISVMKMQLNIINLYKNIVKQPTIIVENEVIENEVKSKVKKLRIVKPKKKLLIVEEEETA